MAGAADPGMYADTILLLGGAVLTAPLFKRLGFGTVLGYLAAGIIIGPVLRLINEPEEVLRFSELGVVFLLFIIGLELKPKRLWSMRRDIFGLGLLQVALCGAVLMAMVMTIASQGYQVAAVIGFGMALSSTAFALQILEQEGALNKPYGQKSFSILLFQDLAIVPLLAVVPFLAPVGEAGDPFGLNQMIMAAAAVAALVLAGRYALNPLLRLIANTGAREVMIAAALLVVLGAATLMQLVGLSMALGAFIAGVMLAESSYRHELEADIEPFRGLLLGLFFMAIGLSLNLGVLVSNWIVILFGVPLLMITKGLIIYLLCRVFGNKHEISVRSAFVLPQGGEFGFVLFAAAASVGILSPSTASILVAVVTLSMALTPLSVWLGEKLIAEDDDKMDEEFEGADEGADVLMIGFSRFGQVAAQILLAGGNSVTVIDYSANRVREAQKFGFRIYFGDGSRKEVLEAAGIRQARIVAITTHRRDITDNVLEVVQREFPQALVYVRSYDRGHTLELRAKGVEYELRETFESGLLFGQKTLEGLGHSEEMAQIIRDDIRRRDTERLSLQAVEGIMAGGHMVHTKPVSAEPLIRPEQQAFVINDEGKVFTADDGESEVDETGQTAKSDS